MDIAASIQKVTEEVVLRIARHVHKITGKDKLCLAGGVALNCVANGRILRETAFKDIWIQPASGDAGGALGAALLVWYKYLGNKRIADGKNDLINNSLLGPAYTDEHIKDFLNRESIEYRQLALADIPAAVADLIAQGNVIGWFQGKMEFGPRALGSRSIIGDARSPQMQSRMNLKIKFRESFRPFAPAVLAEKVSEWFELDKQSPYMLLVAPVKKDKRVGLAEGGVGIKGLEALKVARSKIPAVTHVDYSARVQTVERQPQPLFYDTIKAFYDKTGCPVIINTSFNVRGEPLVCTPQDAFRCFMRTEMDYLVMGGFILDKQKQKPVEKNMDWQKEFQLD
jgi:carbamoyltransferase